MNETLHTATYCPEDNKLRFYPDWDDADFDKEDLKAAGYRWASKQECYVCPRWTPKAEDIALAYCGEIGDEDYSPEERAADRAERFDGYRDKRRSEATSSADAFEAGPSVYGHQNAARAERQARKHDRKRVYAVSQWSKAEYWQQRTEGVISNALYRSSAPVRRGRLVKLETEQRKHEKSREEYAKKYAGWQRVLEMDGAHEPAPFDSEGNIIRDQVSAAFKLAYSLGCDSGRHFWHPTNEEANARYKEIHGENGYFSRGFSSYELLTKTEYCGVELQPMTPAQVAKLWLATAADPAKSGQRWSDHYALRIGYEKAMLENEGGMAGDQEMIPGGFLAGHQILKVNKSPATKRVTSVTVLIDGKQRRLNIERLGEGSYRAPTADELEAFKSQQKAKPKAPSLLNPTKEDAERLQAIWNTNSKSPSEIWEMTQAEYSYRSKGDGWCATRPVSSDAHTISKWDDVKRDPSCKIRTGFSGFTGAYRIIVITDKPQKPLPIDWEAAEARVAEAVTA